MTNTIKFHSETIVEKETEDCKRQRQWMATAKVFPGQNSVVSYMDELTTVVTAWKKTRLGQGGESSTHR